MRYIEYNPELLTLPPGWCFKALRLKAKLIAETDPVARARIIDRNSSVWGEVKPILAKLFFYKCWYTESKQIGTDVDVDHFRPKNRVAELIRSVPPHDGYWWLAFDLANYRYSCIVANRKRRDIETDRVGGKSDYFPIWDEKFRAWDRACDLEGEQPMLLDPCRASDARLLTFKEDGEAMPREPESSKPKQFQRASVSIRYYNLNHSDFVRARIVLRDEMRKLIRDAVKYYNRLEVGDSVLDHAYEQALLRIRTLIDRKSEFSGFCLSYLENYKHLDALAGVLS